MEAYLGLLLLATVLHSHNESTRSLWDFVTTRSIFSMIMSCSIFEQIAATLWFIISLCALSSVKMLWLIFLL